LRREIKRRLNSGNACYHTVQKHLSSRLQSKNVNIRIYKTLILPVLLYGCETWSLSLREEHRLRVFENRMLRRIFEPKKAEVTGGLRKLPSIIIIRRMRWAGRVERFLEKRNSYRILVGKQDGKRPRGRPRRV
jgi:hypothetical protein